MLTNPDGARVPITYHVHTEDKPNLPELTSRYFDGFTLTKGVGYWRGTSEPTAVIEVSTDNPVAVRALAVDIKRENHQESVMVESYDTDTQFI